MVTRILFDPRRDLADGTTGSTAVILEATATRVREDGAVVTVPSTLRFTVNTGADIVQLAPPAASWAWRIVIRNQADNVVRQQRTVRFPDVPSIAYAALTDVDPASLTPTRGAARQWDATFFQLQTQLAALGPRTVLLTQTQYDALPTKDPATLYLISA
jgi:hypothetical protein